MLGSRKRLLYKAECSSRGRLKQRETARIAALCVAAPRESRYLVSTPEVLGQLVDLAGEMGRPLRAGSAGAPVESGKPMLRFNDIADRMLEYNPGVNMELLQSAYVFSAKVHEGQERLSGEPYLIHPLEVAGILVEMRMDDVSVAAGLLHDTLEDTLTTREELERLFGEQVAFLVEGLTKIAKIEFTSVRERQAENFRKMLIAMSKDIRILLIK
ncbi:MAG: hypothetical protein ACI8W3_001312, partial [Myxococcota bacterium]